MKASTAAAPGQNWEDIVFEHRNKDYGAYFNRKKYSKSVVIATIITVGILGFVYASPYL